MPLAPDGSWYWDALLRLGFIVQLKVEPGHTHLYKRRLCNGPSQAGHEKALPPNQEGWEEGALRCETAHSCCMVRDEARGREAKRTLLSSKSPKAVGR